MQNSLRQFWISIKELVVPQYKSQVINMFEENSYPKYIDSDRRKEAFEAYGRGFTTNQWGKMYNKVIKEFKEGDYVTNIKNGRSCMIEKIEVNGVVLDESFGLSTRDEETHVKWINSHGNDGRYSLPLNDFIEQIRTQKNT